MTAALTTPELAVLIIPAAVLALAHIIRVGSRNAHRDTARWQTCAACPNPATTTVNGTAYCHTHAQENLHP